MRTHVALIALAALGIGVLIGGHAQPRAVAGPTFLQGREWSEFITSSSEGSTLYQWTIDASGVRRVTINSLSRSGEATVLLKQQIPAGSETAPARKGGGN
jgi:hypothetical protein